jgi:hypothetical protein
MRVVLEDGTTEDYEDEPFNDGGQGRLYLSRDRKHVIKLYHREDRARLPALRKIMGELNVTRDDPSAVSLFAWINGIVIRPSLGVRMRNVNYALQHKELTWWLSPKLLKKIPEEMRGAWFDRDVRRQRAGAHRLEAARRRSVPLGFLREQLSVECGASSGSADRSGRFGGAGCAAAGHDRHDGLHGA